MVYGMEVERIEPPLWVNLSFLHSRKQIRWKETWDKSRNLALARSNSGCFGLIQRDRPVILVLVFWGQYCSLLIKNNFVYWSNCADSAPDKKYPPSDPDSSNSVVSNGVEIASQNAPGFCFDHLGIINLTLNFYWQVAAAALDSFSMFGYDLQSEPHFVI